VLTHAGWLAVCAIALAAALVALVFHATTAQRRAGTL
jgi:hypothetical protein